MKDIDDILKYLEMPCGKDLNYKILSENESKHLLLYIRLLEVFRK